MNKRLLFLFIAAFSVVYTCFALPAKQKEIIEKLITEGAIEKALSTLEALPESQPADPEYLLLKGICYYQTESYKPQAAPVLLQALASSTNKNSDIDIVYHLAQAYIANEDYANAIKNYNRLRQLVPHKFKDFHKKIDSRLSFCEERLKQQNTVSHSSTTDSLTARYEDTKARNISENPAENMENKQYTIQICSMSFPLSDSFFKGQYGVKLIKMGDLYRYIYNIYDSVEEARAALPNIRKIYPDAFIREFDENKLGKAIDLNLEHIK